MTRRNKYLVGAALGALAGGLMVLTATKVIPRLKGRMEAH
jgi:hypothetical protein